MRAVATAKRKPSARKFAPFSIALCIHGNFAAMTGCVSSDDRNEYTSDQLWNGKGSKGLEGTYRVSESGRTCFAGSPRRPVRSLTSYLYIVCARPTHMFRNPSCLRPRMKAEQRSGGVGASGCPGRVAHSLFRLVLYLGGDWFS